MNFSCIFKYQVHLASVRPRTVYHILYTISLSTPLENFVGICPSVQKREKGFLPCFSIGKKKKAEKNKAKTICMSEIVKSCGNQMLSKHDLQVAVISYCLVYFKNAESRASEPQQYICWSLSVCKSSPTSLKVSGNVQQCHP